MKYIKVTNKTKRIRPLRTLGEESLVIAMKPNKSITIEYKESLKGYYNLLRKIGFTIEVVDDKAEKPSKSTRIVEAKEEVVITEEPKQEEVVAEPILVTEPEEEVTNSVEEVATEEVNTPSSTPKKKNNKKSAKSEETGDING